MVNLVKWEVSIPAVHGRSAPPELLLLRAKKMNTA